MPEAKWKLSRVLAPDKVECPNCRHPAKLRADLGEEARYTCYECGHRFVMVCCKDNPDGGDDVVVKGSFKVPDKKPKVPPPPGSGTHR